MGTFPFDAAGKGRRGFGWNPSYLGINTLLFSHGLELLTRNRDAVRNSAWAVGAIDSYVANAIGRGIRLIPQHPDEKVRTLIRNKWERWIRESDVEYDPANPCSGQTDFYGQQMILARECMEAGEVFVRFRPRSPKEGLAVPIQLQLIEAEQLPLWRNQPTADTPQQNRVRCGVEFRPDGRRAAYHFWQAHPGETMFFPMETLHVERVAAADVLHVYKPIRAGQFRGQPWLTSVLAKLYELEQYTDAEIARKKAAAMITGFIKQVSQDNPVMVPDQTVAQSPVDPGTQVTKLEPNTFIQPGIRRGGPVRPGARDGRLQGVRARLLAGVRKRRGAGRVPDQWRPLGDQLLLDSRRPAGVQAQVRAVPARGVRLSGVPPDLSAVAARGNARDGVWHRLAERL